MPSILSLTPNAIRPQDGEIVTFWADRPQAGTGQRVDGRGAKGRLSTLHARCGYEISVPGPETFTNQVVTFLYLAYKLAGKNTTELARIPELMEQTIDSIGSQAEAIAKGILHERHAWIRSRFPEKLIKDTNGGLSM